MNTQNQERLVCAISGESPSEERANFLTHSIGLVLSLIGFIFLISSALSSQGMWVILSCVIYGSTLVLMYFTSTLYHNCKNILTKQRLRILDHACIYLLIAGSYTPIISGPINGPMSFTIFAVVWSAALLGIGLKIFFTGRFVIISTGLYLLMGWGSIMIVDVLKESLKEEGFIWLIAGGIIYSLGVIFYLWEKLPYNHCIWHLFVLMGSACHYYAITYYIVLITY